MIKVIFSSYAISAFNTNPNDDSISSLVSSAIVGAEDYLDFIMKIQNNQQTKMVTHYSICDDGHRIFVLHGDEIEKSKRGTWKIKPEFLKKINESI